jgi:hypothetical protein
MAKFALPLAVVSLALAGWLALEVSSLRDEVRTLSTVPSVGPAREEAAAPPPIVRAEPASPAADAAPDTSGSAPGAALRGVALEPAEMSRRLTALEEKVQGYEAGFAKWKERAASGEMPRVHFQAPRFIHDLDSAAKELGLDERQKASLGQVVDDSKRELERLHTTPNDEGLTWKEAGKIKFEGNADGGIIAFGGNMEKMEKFRNSKVPGSNETYGEADKRIRRQAKENARRILTPEQQKTFDSSMTDPLFGGMGGDMSVAFSSIVVSDD